MAWLSSAFPGGDRRESRAARIERISDGEPDYQMPPPGDAGYLIDYLSEIGEAVAMGEGLAAISWRDMQAWSELGGVRLSPVEYKALLRLSRAYVAEYGRSNGVDCDMPHIINLPSRDDVERRIKAMFSMFRRPNDD